MKLSESIPGPKALPLLGNWLGMLLYIDSKLHVFCVLPSVTNAIMERYDIMILE